MSAAPLVVSLLAPTFDAFASALRSGAADGADVVEFRLDHVAGEVSKDASPLRALVERAARPTIAALHGDEGFGAFRGDARARCHALRAAAGAGVDFVDIDERFASELGEVEARLILSSHRSARVDDGLDGLVQRLDGLARRGRDLVKVVPAAGEAAESFRLLEWLARRPAASTIAFASGAAGSFTRLLAPAYGSAFVYAAPATSVGTTRLQPAAPGQLTAADLRAVWPSGAPGRATRLAAVVGRPIDHSAGPVVHGAACRAFGLDAMLVPIAPETLGAVPIARGGRDAGGASPRWCGLSVTAPFKLDAFACAESADESSLAMQAANTLTRGADGRRVAANTDAPAVRAALEAAGAGLSGATALVIGAGGAARAAAFALQGAGARVTVAARRAPAARAVAGAVSGVAAVGLDDPAFGALRPTVIVHCTPLGTDGVGEAPVLDAHLGSGVFVLDAVYRPRRTGLLERAGREGAVAVPGSSWFLHQAWLQHVLLFGEAYREAGLDPGSTEPGGLADRGRAAMASALEGWLSREPVR